MKKIKQTEITMEEYSKKINALIEQSKNGHVVETLMLLLEEANKYKIKEKK